MKMKKKLIAAVLSLSLAVSPVSGISAQSAAKTNAGTVESMQDMIRYAAEGMMKDKESTAGFCAVSEVPAAQSPAVTASPVTSVITQTPAVTVTPSPTASAETSVAIFNEDGQIVKVPAPYIYESMSQLVEPSYNKYEIKVPSNYGKHVVVPIKVKSRGALIYAVVSMNNTQAANYYKLYSDAACTKSIATEDNTAYLSKAGTYYIKVDSTVLSETGESILTAAFAFVSGGDRQLKNKSDVLTTTFGTSKPVYYKMKVTKPTKIAISFSTDYKTYGTLCNSKKTALTVQSTIEENDKLVYVVGKGTYYLKVKSKKGFIALSSTFTTVSNAASASKSKAGTLKLNGSTRNALVLPEDSTSRNYYLKFYNPKNQKVYLNVTTSFSSGSVKIEFVDSKGTSYGSKKIASGITIRNVYNPYVYGAYSASSRILPKGTYYIKLTKTQKKASGIVQINVKNKAS